MKIKDAFAQWEDGIKPMVIEQYREDDIPALSESWNDYTDSLCKDGDLTDLQYQHCPAYDDSMPDEDEEPAWLLVAMGVTMRPIRNAQRNDGLMADMPPGSTHYRCTFKRGKNEFGILYSQGPAHKSSPDIDDVFRLILLDTTETDGTFKDWADAMGYDEDSRKAERIFGECCKTAKHLAAMFSASELEDLRTAFEDL